MEELKIGDVVSVVGTIGIVASVTEGWDYDPIYDILIDRELIKDISSNMVSRLSGLDLIEWHLDLLGIDSFKDGSRLVVERKIFITLGEDGRFTVVWKPIKIYKSLSRLDETSVVRSVISILEGNVGV